MTQTHRNQHILQFGKHLLWTTQNGWYAFIVLIQGVVLALALNVSKLILEYTCRYSLQFTFTNFVFHKIFQSPNQIINLLKACLFKEFNKVLWINILHFDHYRCIRLVYFKYFRYTYVLVFHLWSSTLLFSLQHQSFQVLGVFGRLVHIHLSAFIGNIYLATTMPFYLYFHFLSCFND